MEYIYGTTNITGTERENLKTVGTEHTAYTGWLTTVREYTDSTITDHSHIVSHYDSKDGDDGTCYDWYEIDQHYRTIDKSKVSEAKNEKTQALVDYIAMMTDVDIPQALKEGN